MEKKNVNVAPIATRQQQENEGATLAPRRHRSQEFEAPHTAGKKDETESGEEYDDEEESEEYDSEVEDTVHSPEKEKTSCKFNTYQ